MVPLSAKVAAASGGRPNRFVAEVARSLNIGAVAMNNSEGAGSQASLVRMVSTGLVQTNGLATLLWSRMSRVMAS